MISGSERVIMAIDEVLRAIKRLDKNNLNYEARKELREIKNLLEEFKDVFMWVQV